MNNEVKVGAATLAGFLLLAFMLFQLKGFTFNDSGYLLGAKFNQVNGLRVGHNVRYAGVDVGTVQNIDITPRGVSVWLKMRNGAHIPEKSRFTIGSEGLMGEKYVSIFPPDEASGVEGVPVSFLQPGVLVQGEDPQGIEQMMHSFNNVLADTQRLVNSLNEVLGDEKVRVALKETALNAREMTANLVTLSATLAQLAQNNQQDINTMVGNFRLMSESLRDVARRTDGMLNGLDNNGQTVADIRETMKNIRTASERIDKSLAALERIAVDPETSKNIRETLKNTREASAKANQILGKISNVKVDGGAEVLYNSTAGKYRTSADLRVGGNPGTFALIGGSNEGDSSKLNLQIGHRDEHGAQRAGIIDSKPGVGFDSQLGDRLQMSLDVYDPNDVRVKLRAQLKVAPDVQLVGEADGINKRDERNNYFGIRRSF
ncbi:MAG TPA: MlaD family protein [Patescibacteria group bacterium]|nr:MlaD family protein [Patescibacteria group bacterium]